MKEKFREGDAIEGPVKGVPLLHIVSDLPVETKHEIATKIEFMDIMFRLVGDVVNETSNFKTIVDNLKRLKRYHKQYLKQASQGVPKETTAQDE